MLLMSLLIPLQAFADTTVQSASNGSHTFKDNWTKTIQRTYRNSKCVLTYGYNRTAINEDMAYAYTDGAKHRSRKKMETDGATAHGSMLIFGQILRFVIKDLQ